MTQAVGSQVTATTICRLGPLLVNNPLGGHVIHLNHHVCHLSRLSLHHTFLRSIRFQRLLIFHCLRLQRTIQDNHDNEFDGRHHDSQEALLQLHHNSS